MRKFLVWLGATVLLALSACAAPMESGTVVDKSASPAYYTQDQCFSYGKDGQCTYWGPRYHPATFSLRIEGVDSERELVTRWVDVSEGIYDTCAVGMQYTRNVGCSSS